jgi:hypothetical protein
VWLTFVGPHDERADCINCVSALFTSQLGTYARGMLTWREITGLTELQRKLLADHERQGLGTETLLFMARDCAQVNLCERANWPVHPA